MQLVLPTWTVVGKILIVLLGERSFQISFVTFHPPAVRESLVMRVQEIITL